jgi:predicted GTPase
MSRWRVVLVAILLLAPFLTLAGIGSYHLWSRGLGFVAWWPLVAPMVVGYTLALYWQRRRQLLRPVDFAPPLQWTDRDRQAWHLVETRAKKAATLDPGRLSELSFYLDTARELALELARFYHPGAADPLSSLTIPEILTVVELAAQDLAELVDQYLPGGHLLSVTDWRRAKQATEWYQTANKIYWAVTAVFSPVNTAMRYLASQAGISRPLQLLQENLILWFYTAYLHRLGTYLIELNSGRLRVGARRYRELHHVWQGESNAVTTDQVASVPDPADQVKRITLTVLGQVKAGKSSFINALLGEQRAATDVLPTTEQITRYELQPPGIPTRLVLLDTVGYGHTGPKEDHLEATEKAARESDLLLLVLHARNPARLADLELLKGLRNWFTTHLELRMPPVLGILTHVDLLSPAMEWSPPYDWTQPQRPKERAILDAWTAAREQLGEHLVGLVPLCTAPGKVYGLEDWFVPTMAQLLDEAHAVALLRCIKAEADTGKVRKVFRQMWKSSTQIARLLWQMTTKS